MSNNLPIGQLNDLLTVIGCSPMDPPPPYTPTAAATSRAVHSTGVLQADAPPSYSHSETAVHEIDSRRVAYAPLLLSVVTAVLTVATFAFAIMALQGRTTAAVFGGLITASGGVGIASVAYRLYKGGSAEQSIPYMMISLGASSLLFGALTMTRMIPMKIMAGMTVAGTSVTFCSISSALSSKFSCCLIRGSSGRQVRD